nr:MAG TPA: holin [Caudoviricetes sp.]
MFFLNEILIIVGFSFAIKFHLTNFYSRFA